MANARLTVAADVAALPLVMAAAGSSMANSPERTMHHTAHVTPSDGKRLRLHGQTVTAVIDDVSVTSSSLPTPRQLFDGWCASRGFKSDVPVGVPASTQVLFEDTLHVRAGGGEYMMLMRKLALLAAQSMQGIKGLRAARGDATSKTAGGGSVFVPAQEYALQQWQSGRHLFIMGPPGTGKTETTLDCHARANGATAGVLGNTWQQVNLMAERFKQRNLVDFARQAVRTRAAGLNTGFHDNPKVADQVASLTWNAKKVLNGKTVWFEEYFQWQCGLTQFARDMASAVRNEVGFGTLQIGASGGADQILPIQPPTAMAAAEALGAWPRYELPIEDHVLVDLPGVAVVPFTQILRQQGRLSQANKEFGLGDVSDLGWGVIKEMCNNSWPEDAVCLHAWNSLARDGEVADALAHARATGRSYVYHVCPVGDKLDESDLKHVQERYFYHRQVFVVGRKVLLSAFDRKEYFRFNDKTYAHQNMKATVVEITTSKAIRVRCEGRPSHDDILTLPREQMSVYSKSLVRQTFVSGYMAKPFHHQTGANNQGNEHAATVVDMIGVDKPGLLAMMLSRGKTLERMKVINLRGKTDCDQRRYFMKMLVVHPKVVLLRAALSEDMDVAKVRWALNKVEENEQRYGLGLAVATAT